MISDITGIDYNLLKDNIILETTELPIKRKNEKAKQCDFILKINPDYVINLELNRQSHAGLIVKNLSYLFNLFSSSTKKGEQYNEDLTVMQINLNCYNDFKDNKPLSRYHIREDDTHQIYTKNVVIYSLNIVKCHEIYYNEENLEIPNYIRWGELLYCNDFSKIPDIVKGIMTYEERNLIMSVIDKLTKEDLFMSEEEALEWAEWERKTILSDMKKEVTKQVKEEITNEVTEKVTNEVTEKVTIELTNEMIKSMKKQNLDLDIISKITGRTIDEIEMI